MTYGNTDAAAAERQEQLQGIQQGAVALIA